MNKCERCPNEDTTACNLCKDNGYNPLEEMTRKALDKEERRITGKGEDD